MPRVYNPGLPTHDSDGNPMGKYPIEKRVLVPNGPEVRVVKVPESIAPGQYVEHVDGAAYLALLGYGFYKIDPQQWWDVPPGIDPRTVKRMAPWLLTEAEYEEQQPKSEKPAKPEPKALRASPPAA